MSAEPHLLPFKKGAFHLAVQAKVPIIPVVCENYHRLFDGKTRLDRGVLKIKGEIARLFTLAKGSLSLPQSCHRYPPNTSRQRTWEISLNVSVSRCSRP